MALRPLLPALLLLGAHGPLPAQTSEPPKPTAPLVATPAKNTTWTIEVSQDSPPAPAEKVRGGPPPELLKRITVRKDAKLTHILAAYTNGKTNEGYLVGDHFSIRSTTAANEAVVMSVAKGLSGSLEIFTSDYPGTQWIDLAYYRGVEKLGPHTCYVFAREPDPFAAPPANTPPDPLAPPPISFIPIKYLSLKAHIDVETKLPVRVQLGPNIYAYSKVEPYSQSITPPDAFLKAAQEFTRQTDILQRLRAKNATRN